MRALARWSVSLQHGSTLTRACFLRGRAVWAIVRLGDIVKQLGECVIVRAGLLCLAVASVGCGERENILVIEQPTEVHAITQTATASEPSMNVQPGKVIATLKAGETAKAIGVYHGQDRDGFKVKLADGTEGIIIVGDTFRVTSR